MDTLTEIPTHGVGCGVGPGVGTPSCVTVIVYGFVECYISTLPTLGDGDGFALNAFIVNGAGALAGPDGDTSIQGVSFSLLKIPEPFAVIVSPNPILYGKVTSIGDIVNESGTGAAG